MKVLASLRLFICGFCSTLAVAAVLLPAAAVERGPVGLAALDQLDKLPYLWAGREARHVSSHDLTGANYDRGQYLKSTVFSKVLFDARGAGCIYRIWCTNQASFENFTPTMHGDILIYIDGNPDPVVNTSMSNFFNGSYSIFQFPLVGGSAESSGGFYCYIPIPYRESCKIVWNPGADVPGLYYNIDYISYDSPDGVTSFTGTEDISTVKAKWQAFGFDPKSTPVSPPLTDSKTIPGYGGKVVLCDLTGPSSISRIKLKRSSGNFSDSEWTNIIVRIYFDNHQDPDVQTNLARFFGGEIHRPLPGDVKDSYERIDGNIKGLLFGSNGSTGWNYNYFPMPFASNAKIELQNNSSNSVSITYEIATSDMPEAGRLLTSGQIGYFKSTTNLNRVIHNPPFGNDYVLMNESGRGVVVAYVYRPCAGNNGGNTYLEGDERIHIDGALSPGIYGTGTEDIFNGGWYFKQGRFSLPSHGYTASGGSPKGRAMYRLLFGDTIPYSSQIKIGFECGNRNGDTGTDEQTKISGASMYSTVFYYASPLPGTLVLTDTCDVGDIDSETQHNYTKSAKQSYGPMLTSSSYEGDNDGVIVREIGRESMNGYSELTLGIRPDNYGVKIRRMSQYYAADQLADVQVFDEAAETWTSAGIWYDAGYNAQICWKDSEFLIPAAFTQGKTSIKLRLKYTGPWTEYKYQAYTFVSPTAAPPSPVVSDDGETSVCDDRLHFTWTKPHEPVWGIDAYSYAIGTTPGGTDVRGWTEVGNVLSYTVEGLALEDNGTYYISIKAKNGAGVWSSAAVTDGIRVMKGYSVAEAKELDASSDIIAVRGATVTAVFSGFFYIQESGQMSGIRVNSTATVREGDKVDVSGILVTESGERQLNALSVAVK